MTRPMLHNPPLRQSVIRPHDGRIMAPPARQRRNTALLMFGLLLVYLFVNFRAEGQAEEKRDYTRWEKEISEIEKKIASGESKTGRPVFVGSSSIRLWNLGQSFPQLEASNHGFGGSQLSDSVHFFDRIVAPVKPSVIVVYAGDNDIAAGKKAGDVAEDFRNFVARARESLPEDTRIIYIAIKPSIKRWALRDEMQSANQMIQAECEKHAAVKFADVWQPMLDEQGMPRTSLFQKDGLHLNPEGYRVWESVLAKELTLPADAR